MHFEDGEIAYLECGDMLHFDSRIGHAHVTLSGQLVKTIGAFTSESNLMVSARNGVRELQRSVPAAQPR